jgi:hypothetical protein
MVEQGLCFFSITAASMWDGNMGMTLIVSGKQAGKRKPLFEDFSVPIPPEAAAGDGGELTLRALITRMVVAEIEAFWIRQEKRRLFLPFADDDPKTA